MPIGFISGAGGNSPEELFRSLPPISKWLLVSMVGTMLSESLGIFNGYSFALSWPLVWGRFHAWRLLTCIVYPGGPSFGSLIHIYVTTMYAVRYEKDGFNTGGGGSSADFALMLTFGIIIMETLELLLFYKPMIVFGSAIYFYICHVWSRKNPTMTVSFWGLPITAVYVPWVMVGISMLLGQSIHMALLGIAVGHLYYFLVDVLPDMLDIDLLRTPKLLVDIFGWGRGGTGVNLERPGMPPPGVVQPPGDIPRTGRPAQWGRGRTLGSS